MLKFKFKYYIPGITWALVILVLCLLPGNKFPKAGFWDFLPVDKIIHAFLFLILSALFFWALEKNKQQNFILNCIIGLAICVFYGLVIEMLQEYFTTSRHAEMIDVFADLFGGIVAIFFYAWYRKKYIFKG